MARSERPSPRVALAPFETTYARHAMVCTVDHLATSAGVALLRAGGSAVDAAVGANAVLAVTTQHLCGLGGDLFALVHVPGQRAPAVLNASGRAGSGADPATLRAEGHATMPLTGDIRAVTVPGCVDGWMALHERFGRLPLAAVLEPAYAYAAEGFPASPTLALASARLAGVPESDDYTARGRLVPGALVSRPGVARALRAIAEDGRSGFYEGEFGERLLALGDGEYTSEDLLPPNADWVEPLGLGLLDHRLWTVPPNSQGYLTLAAARILQGLDVPEDPDDELWAHLLVEAARQAGYDRPEVLHEHADGAALLAEDRLSPRRAAIDRDRASELGGAYGKGGTIFLCAVDGDGMGVSLIQSNYMGFGSLLVVPGLRIFLHNRGAGFSLEPGHPAEYAPGRRPPHTLSPSIVTHRDGSLDAVLGTMGGDSQPQILLQLVMRRYGAAASPGAAIAAPRWILADAAGGPHTWAGGGVVDVLVEAHAPEAWFGGLERRGHRVVRAPAWSGGFGHAHMIAVGDGHLAGAADPRSLAGAAAGY